MNYKIYSQALIFANSFFRHFAVVNVCHLGFTKDFAGINFRELSLTKDFAGINFREIALFKDFMGVNLTFTLWNIFSSTLIYGFKNYRSKS